MATFQTITTGKKQYLPLLLLADPCEAMIDRYLEAGEMHVIKAGNAAVCEAVVLPLSETASGAAFYARFGFEPSHTVVGFFIDNYPEPIYENGERCTDMLYFKKELR